MPTFYKIALAQINSTADLDKNLQTALELVREAKKKGASLIAFPESFLFLGVAEETYKNLAEPLDGPMVTRFSALAKELGIHILMGGFAETNPQEPQKLYNTSILIGSQGKLLGHYRKIHLFDTKIKEVMLKESNTVSPGKEVVCLDHELGPFGLTICYDLRFPAMFQSLRRLGAKVIFVPAAFTFQTGRYHWVPLLQARAIETQCFIVAPAQAGWHNQKRHSFGHSLVIDPWGQIIADGGPEATGLVMAQIDLAQVDQVRAQMPVLEHQVAGIDR